MPRFLIKIGSGLLLERQSRKTGRTEAQKLFQNKDVIVASYESNMKIQQKISHTGKYSNVNQAQWDWYSMCRNSNILVSGPMLQEEVVLITEKLGTVGFVASNGWLDLQETTQELQYVSGWRRSRCEGWKLSWKSERDYKSMETWKCL